MSEVILDTDILSEVLKGINAQVIERLENYQQQFDRLTFTSASVMEILTGFRKRSAIAQEQRARTLFEMNKEIVPEAADYRLAADINGDLLRDGKIIGFVDPLIAACAIRRGYGLASGNTAHFDFIRKLGYDLRLDNWRERPESEI